MNSFFYHFRQNRHEILANTRSRFEANKFDPIQKLDEIAQYILPSNVFITVFEFEKYQFTAIRKPEVLRTKLGYLPGEFTMKNLLNTGEIPIVYKEDFEHVNRYNTLIYRMFGHPCFRFRSLDDCYQLTFRVYKKDRGIVWVQRSCYLFELDLHKRRPVSHLDVWEVKHHPPQTPYVEPSFQTDHHEEVSRIFYYENTKELGISFSRRQLQVLQAKVKGMFDKEVADLLECQPKTIANHLSAMRNKVNEFYMKRGISHHVTSKEELIDFARRYGLYPIPLFYLE